MNSNTLSNSTASAQTRKFDVLSFEIERTENYFKSEAVSIEVEAELDFGTIYCWVRSGLRILGLCTRNLDERIWYGKSYYHNPNGRETTHDSSNEAIDAIVAAFTGESDYNCRSKPNRVIYHLTLQTEEVDEEGNSWEHKVCIELDADAEIDWNLWLLRYSEQHNENFDLINIVKVDREELDEF